MSSETLRRAAALMRERAEGRTGRTALGPWRVEGDYSEAGMLGADVVAADGAAIGYVGRTLDDAEHIASWHPAVALAVADLLERLVCSCHPADDDSGHCVPREALVVARAYLGEQS